MSAENMQLFWALLDAQRLDGAMKCITPDFQWNELHPIKNTTVLVEAIVKGISSTPAQARRSLELIKRLCAGGASWSQKCRGKDRFLEVWKEGQRKKLQVVYGCHSALSFAQAWLRQFADKEDFFDDIAFLGAAMESFAIIQAPARERVSIDEGIVDLWEKVLLAIDSHDLTIDTAEGPVTAHALILKEASPVVRAMLKSSMKEQRTQRIQVTDSPRGAVALLLDILYTCSSQSEPDYKTVVAALDLAHRWQVQVVVRILAELLEQMITDESFASIAEHAALKGLEALKKACQKFGAESKTVQDQLKKDTLPKVVKEMFHQEPTAAPRKKRKCF